jgi:DNA-binding MarR family transcriptional regulator
MRARVTKRRNAASYPLLQTVPGPTLGLMAHSVTTRQLPPDREAKAERRAVRTAELALDRLLELLERRRLSIAELRMLLALLDSDVPGAELAYVFGRRSVEIRRAAARLDARGLLRWRHDAGSREPAFAITPAGLAMIRPLLTAVGKDALPPGLPGALESARRSRP